MPEPRSSRITDAEIADPRWKDLYRIGGVASILIAVAILFAIAAFFIWPFKPGSASTADIFAALQADRLGGLMSLDLPMPVIVLMSSLPLLALYVALKRVNESLALIALVLGLISIVALIPARSLAELVLLSESYARATSEAARNHYLAAGEALHALFNGTAWMVYTVLGGVSTLIFSWLMLRSRIFSPITAYIGFASVIGGMGIFIPLIGIPLSLLATLGGVIWSILLARTFVRLGWPSWPANL